MLLTAFSQATAGVPSTDEAGDRFGSTLAVGHHGTTLLVGVSDEDMGSVTDAGAVQLSGTGPLRLPASVTENASGTAGSVGTGHHFGRSL